MLNSPVTLHVSMTTGRIFTKDIVAITFCSEEKAKEYIKMIDFGENHYVLTGNTVTVKPDGVTCFHLYEFTHPRPKDTTQSTIDYLKSVGAESIFFNDRP